MAKIDSWLSNQLPNIRKNLEVVKSCDFIHISTDNSIRKMNPRIGDRQMKTEDRTIPRICGAPTLYGCILGHGALHHYAMQMFHDDKHEKVSAKTDGLLTIYRIEQDAVVRPKSKLVPDVKVTGEVWIVPYAPEAYELKPKNIGKLMLAVARNEVVCGISVEINQFYLMLNASLDLTDGQKLTPGFYAFDINGKLNDFEGERPGKVSNLRTIGSSQWDEALSSINDVLRHRREEK